MSEPPMSEQSGQPVPWARARVEAYEAGRAVAACLPPVEVALAGADGLTLARPLAPLTDLPAFPTSSVDGYAVRGSGPWRLTGRVLAGAVAEPLAVDGTAVEIATGAMVPEGTTAIVRVEDATLDAPAVDDPVTVAGAATRDARVSGAPRAPQEWRMPGEEASQGEELLPSGTPVTPAVIGLAAACGYDTLVVHRRPYAALLVFGDELLTAGAPGAGRVRDALGPQIPAWLSRLGAAVSAPALIAPVADTLADHVHAIRGALAGGADVVCTTGGTMHGPVDHLHPALRELGAEYVADTVAVRPGFPMMLARFPTGQFLVGLPGNPQSAIVALVSLGAPLLAGLSGRQLPELGEVTLGEPISGRRGFTHLALVHADAEGLARPTAHVGSAMLRGLARSVGFAVIAPHSTGEKGARVPLVPLPLLPGEQPC